MKIFLGISTVILSFLFGWVVFELFYNTSADQLVAFVFSFVVLTVIIGIIERQK